MNMEGQTPQTLKWESSSEIHQWLVLESPLLYANKNVHGYKRGQNSEGSWGIASLSLTGMSTNIPLISRSAGRFSIRMSFPTRKLEGQLQLTLHLRETEGETVWGLLRGPPSPPLPHLPPPWESRPLEEQCHQKHMPGRFWSLGHSPGQGHSSIISAELMEEKLVEEILLRSGMVQSLEVWIQNIKRLQFFIWLSPEWKTI